MRFLVAMGVGGEWAIAASLVSEVFPKRARAAAGGIFHASSVLGAVFASLCGMLLDESDWRMAFLIGLAPALLIVWIRVSLRESEKWQESQTAGPNAEPAPASGSVLELLITPRTRNRALIGLCLASIGLGTYWGIYAWGPELARQVLIEDVEYLSGDALDRRIVEVMDPYLDEEVMATQAEATGLSAAGISVVGAAARLQEQSSPDTAQIRLLKDNQETLTAAAQAFVAGASRETLEPQLRKLASGPLGSGYRAAKGSSAYLFMNFTGGLLGLLCFAPLASCTGRRRAFAVYHVGALILAPATFLLADNYEVCVILLSVMAFFVVGMHAGYAIYFPELFPTRLRATGTSFCFNVARLISAVVIVARVPIRQELGLREAVAVMALLFSVGLVILWFAPETRDVELED